MQPGKRGAVATRGQIIIIGTSRAQGNRNFWKQAAWRISRSLVLSEPKEKEGNITGGSANPEVPWHRLRAALEKCQQAESFHHSPEGRQHQLQCCHRRRVPPQPTRSGISPSAERQMREAGDHLQHRP